MYLFLVKIGGFGYGRVQALKEMTRLLFLGRLSDEDETFGTSKPIIQQHLTTRLDFTASVSSVCNVLRLAIQLPYKFNLWLYRSYMVFVLKYN